MVTAARPCSLTGMPRRVYQNGGMPGRRRRQRVCPRPSVPTLPQRPQAAFPSAVPVP